MLKFPPLKPGDRINRTWFNRLIEHVNSLYLSGDGITTRVSHGSAGTVVSAVPQIAEAAGGGGYVAGYAGDFAVTQTGTLTVSIAAGHCTIAADAKEYSGNNGANFQNILEKQLTLPSANGTYIIEWIAHYKADTYPNDYYSNATMVGDYFIVSSPLALLPGVVQFPIALATVTGGSIASIVQIQHGGIFFSPRVYPGLVTAYYDTFPASNAPSLATTTVFAVGKVWVYGGLGCANPYTGLFWKAGAKVFSISGSSRLYVTSDGSIAKFDSSPYPVPWNDSTHVGYQYVASLSYSSGSIQSIEQGAMGAVHFGYYEP